MKELLAAYEDEWSAYWLYTRALVAFREGHASEQQAVRLVQDAWSANQHVPAILAGAEPAVTSRSGYITMGGADEATDYVRDYGPALAPDTGCSRMAEPTCRRLAKEAARVRNRPLIRVSVQF